MSATAAASYALALADVAKANNTLDATTSDIEKVRKPSPTLRCSTFSPTQLSALNDRTGSSQQTICLSDACVFGVTYVLYHIASVKVVAWLFCIYGVPLLIVNGFLVTITYLQYTHYALPHYDSSKWDWLRGALATVDRDYGILNKVFHHTTDTHVTHHLFSTMPHYHAMEATKAVKPILGEYYQFDGTPFYKALWREARECIYVEPDEAESQKGIYWYRSKF